MSRYIKGTEPQRTRSLDKVLRERFRVQTLPIQGDEVVRGWPDRFYSHVLIIGGCFVEWKVENGKLRPDQQAVISELYRQGSNVMIGRFRNNGCHELWTFDERVLYWRTEAEFLQMLRSYTWHNCRDQMNSPGGGWQYDSTGS